MNSADRLRFWSKATVGDGCWEWQASKRGKGYGAFCLGGKMHVASRVAYEDMVGSIPSGLVVCHRCDNPGCVRPGHLFAATHMENKRDMVSKGREALGERYSNSKLTAGAVKKMLADRATGMTTYALADKHGVSPTRVRMVLKGRAWKHVER